MHSTQAKKPSFHLFFLFICSLFFCFFLFLIVTWMTFENGVTAYMLVGLYALIFLLINNKKKIELLNLQNFYSNRKWIVDNGRRVWAKLGKGRKKENKQRQINERKGEREKKKKEKKKHYLLSIQNITNLTVLNFFPMIRNLMNFPMLESVTKENKHIMLQYSSTIFNTHHICKY